MPPGDEARFREACLAACVRERGLSGIGTLSEKTLHAALKLFIEPNEALHEVKLGRHCADIRNANGVFEIQTRSFNRLRGKLDALLETERVTVVYPIPAEKRLVWLDRETGEMTSPRKSPKRGGFCDAFTELYKLGPLIAHPSLAIWLLLINLDEYRFRDGWSADGKKGSTRCERIPTALAGSVLLAANEDYLRLLPASLPDAFTSRTLASAAKLRLRAAQVMLTVLQKRGAVRCVGKEGRLKLYQKAEPI